MIPALLKERIRKAGSIIVIFLESQSLTPETWNHTRGIRRENIYITQLYYYN